MPTFVKTGYWDKLSKAPKGFLNLEDLIASSIGSGLPGEVAIWGASGLGGSSNLVWDSTNNRLGVNNSTPLFSADITGTARITGATLISPVSTINTYNYFSSFNVVNNGPASIAVDRFSNNVTSPHFNLRKSRGTTTAPLIVQTNDELGYVGFWGHDGTNFQRNGIILTQAFNVTGTTITPVMRFGVGVNAGSNQYHISLHNTGNTIFGPDSTADTGQKVQVIGDVFIKGSGATSATNALVVQNSTGLNQYVIANNGEHYLYSNNNLRLTIANSVCTFGSNLVISGANNLSLGQENRFDINYDSVNTIGRIRVNNGGMTNALTVTTLGTVRVGIGQGIVQANASSVLELSSTTLGFLPPRMTTAQKNAIATPAAGLVVYDTGLNKLCVFTTGWQTITSA